MDDDHGRRYDVLGIRASDSYEQDWRSLDPYTGYPVSLPSSVPYTQDNNVNYHFPQETAYNPARPAPAPPPPPQASQRNRTSLFPPWPFSRVKKTGPSTQYTSIDPASSRSLSDGDDPQQRSKTPPAKKTKNQNRNNKENGKAQQYTWTIEYCAVALSLATVITTLALLLHADGLPLVQYNFVVSFNAVVSILGAVARVSLGFAIGSCLGQGKWNFFRRGPGSVVAFERFEDASRGPWGSLWLVAWLRLRHWAVAGAVITLLLLGFEPFLQSVIYYEGTMEPIDTAAAGAAVAPSIGRSAYLDAGVYYPNNGGVYQEKAGENTTIPTSPFSSQPDMGMISALFNGFYNRSSTKTATTTDLTASFTCPTGNCTWAPFTSIATCSACRDVTDRLQTFTEEGSNLGTLNYHAQVYAGAYLKHALPYANLSNTVGVRGLPAYLAAKPLAQPRDTIAFRHLDTLLAAVGVIRADDAYRDDADAEWNETAVTATECALWLCANAYASEVRGGVLRERVLASWALRDPRSYGFRASRLASPEEMAAFDAYYGRPLWVDGIEFEREDLALRIPADEAREKAGLSLGDADTDADADEASFAITQRAIGSTMRYIHRDFFRLDDDVELLVWPIDGDEGSGVGQPPVTQALYQSADLGATFANAARSLSNWMRDHRPDDGSGSASGDPGTSYGSGSSGSSSSSRRQSTTDNTDEEKEKEKEKEAETVAYGTALQYVIRIRVDWAYLSLPAATIVAGCLFVLFSVLETRRLGLEPWKTDVMASLIHALDPQTREELRMAEMEAASSASGSTSGVAVAGEKGGEKKKKRKKKDFHQVVKNTIIRMEEHGDGNGSGGPELRAVREIKPSETASSSDNAASGDARSSSRDRSSVSALSQEEQVHEGWTTAAPGYEYQPPAEYSAWEYHALQQQQRRS